MIVKPFGAAWNYTYKPQVGGEYVTPTGTPSIYVFTDRPSEAVARAGTGAIQTISAWTYTASTNSALFSVAAIADPQDGTREKDYWIAINYSINSGAQKQLDLRSFRLSIPDGMDENPTPTVASIFTEYDRHLDAEFEPGDVPLFITRAEKKVKRDLKWSGYSWPKVESMSDLYEAVAHATLMYLYNDLIKTPNDVWDLKYQRAEADYKVFLGSIKIIYDENEDNQIDENEENAEGTKTTRLIR